MQSLSTSRYFYPRPPGGGRRVTINQQDQDAIFLSTPSGWRATQSLKKNKTNCAYFYPRPPGGGRPWTPYVLQSRRPFLSTPSGWRATWGWFDSDIELIFLSTPSGWRATKSISLSSKIFENFYPRPPGGGRPAVALDTTLTHEGISIHALRVEGDCHLHGKSAFVARFLSTPSGWRATRRPDLHHKKNANFYPRPPGGGRPRTTQATLDRR